MGETKSASKSGLLDVIETIGNKLPDPATMFLLGTILVIIMSAVVAGAGWEIESELPKQVLDADGEPVIVWEKTGDKYAAKSLLTRDGFYWAIESMVDNFVKFPPLGVVLVGMLGIGIAERTGFIGAILKAFMLITPGKLLTPAMVFIGIMSSMTLDAGYVILPPLAAALYKAVGRSPLAGLAAVFAGVSAGFNANLLVTGLDPMLAGFSTTGAQTIEENYKVAATCNWWFMIVSTFVITLTGWAVTSFFVERRLHTKPPEEGGPVTPTAEDLAEQRLKPEEKRSMNVALIAMALSLGVFLALILIPRAPLHTYYMPDPAQFGLDDPEMVIAEIYEMPEGQAEIPENGWVRDSNENGQLDPGELVLVPSEDDFSRWVEVIVPIIFFCFIVPGIAYGVAVRRLRNDKDVAKLLIESMAGMAPIIVLAFFAAQFIEYFKYSGMDKMLAMWGGMSLGKAGLSKGVLIIAFILVTMIFNMFIGSMSAKYAMFAPIFIPMFMMVGISPELTQAAYRIGDSVSNIITPLNAYLIIILVFMQQYVPKGGMGTLISTMLPYSIVFAIVWTILLLIWIGFGWDLGPGGPLEYVPTAAG